MPTLDQHQSSDYIKMLYIGDSGTGKTGSLVSLLGAGYSFNILDMDEGLSALVYYGKEAGYDLSKINYESFRDEYKMAVGGPVIKGMPKAFGEAMKQLTAWSEIADPMTITVIDSLTFLGKAAYAWAKGMNPAAKEPRTWFYTAQQALENVLSMLTSKEYKQNVIIISHVNYKEVTEGVNKGYPTAIGSALGPTIASYFDILILAEATGSGTNVRRKIKTLPTGVIDLKMPNPKVDKELPLESGLATIVAQLKDMKS